MIKLLLVFSAGVVVGALAASQQARKRAAAIEDRAVQLRFEDWKAEAQTPADDALYHLSSDEVEKLVVFYDDTN